MLGRLRILRPLRVRDFALLWTGMTISMLGDGIWTVALAWQVYELSNAPTALSIVLVAQTVPQVAFLLVGGALSDRFDRRRLMIAADLTRAGAVGVIGALSITGSLELWHVVALVLVYGIGQSLFFPAFTALVPELVPEESLVEANSLDNVVRPLVSRLAGPALGGIIIAVLGVGEAILLDAASFGASIGALLAMRPRPRIRDAAAPPTSMRREIGEGLRFVRSQTWLWGTLVAAAFTLLLSFGPQAVLIPYVIKNDLGGGADDLGLVFAAGAPGAILASLILGQTGLPRRNVTVMLASWGGATVLLAGFAVFTATWQAMIAFFFFEAGVTIGTVIWATLMQMLVPRELLGRVSSIDYLVSFCLLPASAALAGPVAAALGARTTLMVAGLGGAAIAWAFLFLPGIRDPERRTDRNFKKASGTGC